MQYEDDDMYDENGEERVKVTARYVFKKIVEHPGFDGLSFLFIILNTVTLAMDDYTNAISTENFLKLSNKWFTIIFTIEMLFKIIALGCRGYAREGYNLFDGILVMISLFDFALEEF
jgi:purine-cytosine permease-like protein